MEKWKKIQGYEQYKVSTHGRIMNGSGKILSQFLSTKRYPKVMLYKNNKRKSPYVHRLVAIAFIPNPHNKPQVNHLDGVKTNNHFKNLDWCTNYENAHHAIANGLFRNDAIGEKHPRTKLTNAQALEIRNAVLTTSFGRKMLAKKYNTTESIVQEIRYGRSFRYL